MGGGRVVPRTADAGNLLDGWDGGQWHFTRAKTSYRLRKLFKSMP